MAVRLPELAPAQPTRTWPFFATALGITGALQLPAVLAQRGLIPGGSTTLALPAALGTFGPLIAALIAARMDGSRPRSVFASLRRRIPVFWVPLALFGFGALHALAWAVYRASGGAGAGSWLYLPESSVHVAALLLVPIAEEPGWRGFALPRLQARYGARAASLRLGVAWSVWHTAMFLLAGVSPALFAISLLNILAGSVVFSWLYNRSGGSLLVALLAHAGAHLDNPSHALPAHPAPMVVFTVGVVLAASVLMAFDRRAWPGPSPAARTS